jgi:hypothetical protein
MPAARAGIAETAADRHLQVMLGKVTRMQLGPGIAVCDMQYCAPR